MSPITSPIVASALGSRIIQNPGEFVRLVLLEAARFGMPGQLVAVLDEVAASIGLYSALPATQSAYLAAPVMQWRSSPHMPTNERTPEVEALSYAQRSEIAFGASRWGMVGPAEIVCAMNNCIPDDMPAPYRRIFDWAAVHVRADLERITPEEAAKKLDFPLIPDDDVLKPRGPLYATYVEIAQSLRRTATASLSMGQKPKATAIRTSMDLLVAIEKRRKEITGDNAEEAAHLDRLSDLIHHSIEANSKALMAEERAVPA